jgi:hypothetical protein
VHLGHGDHLVNLLTHADTWDVVGGDVVYFVSH